MFALAILASGLLEVSAADTTPGQKLTPLQKAKTIKLPQVSYSGIPLSEVLTHLNNESNKRDPEGKGVKITLAENIKTKGLTAITLNLKNVTLADALASIAKIARLRLQETDTGIVLTETTGNP